MNIKLLLSGFAMLLLSTSVKAQFRNNNNHHERLRIAQGVRNGSLTRGEAMRLRLQNARVNRYERQAASDGLITPREQRRERIMERRLNRQIYIQKHDFQRR